MFQQTFWHLLRCDLWEQERSSVVSMETGFLSRLLSLLSPVEHIRGGGDACSPQGYSRWMNCITQVCSCFCADTERCGQGCTTLPTSLWERCRPNAPLFQQAYRERELFFQVDASDFREEYVGTFTSRMTR